MPKESPAKRKLRRLRRERTLAFRMVQFAAYQRDQARLVATGLEEELKKYLTPETVGPSSKTTITKIADDPEAPSVE